MTPIEWKARGKGQGGNIKRVYTAEYNGLHLSIKAELVGTKNANIRSQLLQTENGKKIPKYLAFYIVERQESFYDAVNDKIREEQSELERRTEEIVSGNDV